MEDSGIDSDPKNVSAKREKHQGNLSDSSSSSNSGGECVKTNSARQLQKKLEQKIQEAKKYQKIQQDQKKISSCSTLIPIQRLSIPAKTVTKEHLPLVDWDSEDSEEDVHFFPVKPPVKHELTDTFSLEEYQISPDEDDLNLLPPLPTYQRLSFCCFNISPSCNCWHYYGSQQRKPNSGHDVIWHAPNFAKSSAVIVFIILNDLNEKTHPSGIGGQKPEINVINPAKKIHHGKEVHRMRVWRKNLSPRSFGYPKKTREITSAYSENPWIDAKRVRV